MCIFEFYTCRKYTVWHICVCVIHISLLYRPQFLSCLAIPLYVLKIRYFNFTICLPHPPICIQDQIFCNTMFYSPKLFYCLPISSMFIQDQVCWFQSAVVYNYIRHLVTEFVYFYWISRIYFFFTVAYSPKCFFVYQMRTHVVMCVNFMLCLRHMCTFYRRPGRNHHYRF